MKLHLKFESTFPQLWRFEVGGRREEVQVEIILNNLKQTIRSSDSSLILSIGRTGSSSRSMSVPPNGNPNGAPSRGGTPSIRGTRGRGAAVVGRPIVRPVSTPVQTPSAIGNAAAGPSRGGPTAVRRGGVVLRGAATGVRPNFRPVVPTRRKPT